MFSKRDWFVLLISGLIGLLIFGAMLYGTFRLISKFVGDKKIGEGLSLSSFLDKEKLFEDLGDISSMGQDLDDMTAVFDDENITLDQNFNTLISLRGEPTKKFKKGEETSLKNYLKGLSFQETSEWTDYATTEVKDENDLLNFSNEKIMLKNFPNIENEVMVYSLKELCSAEVFYGDAEKKVTHYFIGFGEKCDYGLPQ